MATSLTELKEMIDSSGGLANYRRSGNANNAWNVAFKRYNEETGDRLKQGCLSCAKKVYSWLKTKA